MTDEELAKARRRRCLQLPDRICVQMHLLHVLCAYRQHSAACR